MRTTLLLVLLCAGSARAAEAPAIAVMQFVASESDANQARGLSGVVAARLASHRGARVVGLDEITAALSLEKQKAMLGCNQESCLAEISGALGVRYIVHGRLDRFGK